MYAYTKSALIAKDAAKTPRERQRTNCDVTYFIVFIGWLLSEWGVVVVVLIDNPEIMDRKPKGRQRGGVLRPLGLLMPPSVALCLCAAEAGLRGLRHHYRW
jgi:hypothetical protein